MATSSYTDTRLLINNEWCDAASGKTIEVINPATGKAIGKVAHAGIADLDRALAAAQKGFEAWRKIPPMNVPPPCAKPPVWCANAPPTSLA